MVVALLVVGRYHGHVLPRFAAPPKRQRHALLALAVAGARVSKSQRILRPYLRQPSRRRLEIKAWPHREHPLAGGRIHVLGLFGQRGQHGPGGRVAQRQHLLGEGRLVGQALGKALGAEARRARVHVAGQGQQQPDGQGRKPEQELMFNLHG
ncbi:hypothetical protein [Hymenobacter sp. BRD128]|uniref:hypothetical protein n=1 Tax=Hymenobacter sp. BRD128 TaxID=2675878 RepID=UPI0020B6B0FA|nr:hypothetical protein [Hymenobacter sp. BRD128]